ncbi:putative zinc-binding oxidoreductase ToxD [Ilyonectria sp. MPI-CAGE-AT-0026]|nr:putative zinc-binding oxidoreductase ToxD [Ilyonectria sp. MPI-CAGE-AT-0026]
MKAIKLVSPHKTALVSNAPIPKVRPDRILVKNKAFALNPVDWKFIDAVPYIGTTVGCDYAGVVEAVGEDLKVQFKKGDRIAGMVHGINPHELESGAFAEYVLVKSGCQLRIPDNLSFEEASSLGIGIITSGQGLYESLGLPWPEQPKERFPVLIYGGSTATGTISIQLAKLSGLEVITTCSPRNFDLVRGLGADVAFDYNSPTCSADIRHYTKDRLHYAFDCWSEGQSGAICVNAMASSAAPGKKLRYGSIQPMELPRKDVQHLETWGNTAYGEDFEVMGTTKLGNPDRYEFATAFFRLAQRLLEEGKLKPHPIQVGKGGLNGVLAGLDELRQERVCAHKLVYRVEDTEGHLSNGHKS